MKEKISGKRKYLFLPLLSLVLLFIPGVGRAADAAPVKMDDALWSNGKIYVVVLVLFTIFLGIILTLLYLERRIKRLEKKEH